MVLERKRSSPVGESTGNASEDACQHSATFPRLPLDVTV